MHELGITQNIVAIALDHAKAAKVQRITLEIGKLSAVLPDAIQFCFDVCCAGTALEGAELKIIEIPGLGCCRRCGTKIALDQPFGVCRCGSTDLEILLGEELKIKELEVEELCV
jgi:hydrogenase nickel incorporation protein HypA/HybF